ncbi:hypothetical protein [Streptomyces sp. NPDC054866]
MSGSCREGGSGQPSAGPGEPDSAGASGQGRAAAGGRGQDTGEGSRTVRRAGHGAPLLRGGLIFLAVTQFAVGFWQLLAPRSFFGSLWVSTLPPYNEHLMRDLGAMVLALGVVVAAAAWSMEPRLISVALAADLTFTVPHLVFHSAHSGHLSAGSALTLLGLLGGAVLLPAWLLLLAARGAGRTARPAPRP